MNVVNEHIKYQDNFLDINLIESISAKLHNSLSPWYMQKSLERHDGLFWYCSLKETEEDNGKGIENKLFADEVKMLEKTVPREIIRIYVNGQSINQHGDFHDDDGDETILIGLNKEMAPALGGATEFLLDNNVSYLIYPMYNRAIFFNAKLIHRALPSSHPFRLTLALKTIK